MGGTGLWLAVLLAGAAGCGGKPTGVVSGQVTFNKVPLSFGMIAFVTNDGQTVSSGTIVDGAYSVPGVPAGPAVVTVTSLRRPPMMGNPTQRVTPEKPATPVAVWDQIPERYSSRKQSGLQYTVSAGDQQKDFDLGPLPGVK